MNSYFASAEQYLRPELRGRPVGVVPVLTDSTCLIAASIQAKPLGIRTGTSVPEARRLCPGIQLVEARPSVYVQIHHRILESVNQCALVHKVYSIDEWSTRLLGKERYPAQARELARRVKQQLRTDFGPWLTCSIGIAPTRLLAKMASDLQKPDGLTVLTVEDLPGPLEARSLQDLCGISDGMEARLNRHGIHTIRELWESTQDQAVQIWGSITGSRWWAGFHGIDEPEPPTQRQSMSHENVLEPRFRNPEGARSILTRLVCKLGYRLRHERYSARTLQLSLHDVQYRGHTDKIALASVHDTPTLLENFYRLWERRPVGNCPLKKVGVTVGGLVLTSQVPISLFDEDEKRNRVSRTIDEINDRWGASKIYFGPVHHYRHLMENKIAFGRIPDQRE